MVQGLPGTSHCKGPLDAVRKVMKTEGIRGLYRGFGLAVLTQPPASALWWGAYAASHHLIWRYIYIYIYVTLTTPYTYIHIYLHSSLLLYNISLCRGLGYCEDNTDKNPSHLEMVTVQATAGMLAGALSSLVTTPIDTVKTRLQVILLLLLLHCPYELITMLIVELWSLICRLRSKDPTQRIHADRSL